MTKSKTNKDTTLKIIPIVVLVVVVLLTIIVVGSKAVLNGQETGQVGVWTSWTKKFVKTTTETGINNYNPFNKVTYYDIKNNTVKFTTDPVESEHSVNSPSITIQNKEGVSGDVELSVTYSIKPDYVKEIWETYGSQTSFNSNFVVQIIRSNVRDVFTQYNSLQTYNDRAKIEKEINDNLVKEFKDKGVIINTVALQNVIYSKEIIESFNAYQKKAVEIETAKAEREKALITAEKNLEVAKKDAEANKVKSQAIDDKILAQEYIEAIRETQNKVIITDGKTIPYVNFGK